MNLKIKVLDLGNMTFYKNELIKTDNENEMIVSPSYAILIQHPAIGNVLYDTGNDDSWDETYSDDMKRIYPITKLTTIKEALQKEGLTPSDIDLLILSHFHFDHVGGLKYFSGTKAGKKVLAYEHELKDAFYKVNIAENGICGAYMRPLFCNLSGIGFLPINDETELANGLTLFIQRCHTAGVIGLKIDLKNEGTVIFCGDTIYTKESYDREIGPGGGINKTDAEFHENLSMIKEMKQKFNAQIFFGHDIKQTNEWQNRGWID